MLRQLLVDKYKLLVYRIYRVNLKILKVLNAVNKAYDNHIFCIYVVYTRYIHCLDVVRTKSGCQSALFLPCQRSKSLIHLSNLSLATSSKSPSTSSRNITPSKIFSEHTHTITPLSRRAVACRVRMGRVTFGVSRGVGVFFCACVGSRV